MGGSERYCGICCASLGICELEVGPNTELAQRIRREVVDIGLRKRAGQRTELNRRDWGEDEEEAYDSVYQTYDPEIMAGRDDTLPNHDSFLAHVRLVMCDPDIKDSSQYFISGEADPNIYGSADVYGGHPERPDDNLEADMYWVLNQGRTKAFPCHGLCLQMAAKVIFGHPDARLLDPETLYRVMCDEFHGGVNGFGDCLSLNYGDIQGPDQYWTCIPGYEYCIMNPLEFYDLHMETIVHLTVEHEPHQNKTGSIQGRNTITDPFQKLSNELILHMANHLEAKDLFSLRQASMIAREVTSGNTFWKPRVQKDMAWLWIPNQLFDDAKLRSERTDEPLIDWMKVYLLFDGATASPYGMSGLYMGLANRRRVWKACEQLKSAYVSYAAKHGRSLANPNPARRTWALDNEIDSLWSEALDVLESPERWLGIRSQAGRTEK